MLTLYHVSLDTYRTETSFTPRVPTGLYGSTGEDMDSPRICFSDSVEGCFEAISIGSNSFAGHNMLVVVYEMEVEEDDPYLMHPEDVREYVPDALENMEYWYLKPVTLQGAIFEIVKLEREPCIAWSALNVADVIRIMNGEGMFPPGDTAKELWDNFLIPLKEADLTEKEKCDTEDRVYDQIVELPWATGYKVRRLELRPEQGTLKESHVF